MAPITSLMRRDAFSKVAWEPFPNFELRFLLIRALIYKQEQGKVAVVLQLADLVVNVKTFDLPTLQISHLSSVGGW